MWKGSHQFIDMVVSSLIPEVGLEGIEHKFQHIKYVG